MKVIYNGGTTSYNGCSSHKKLIVGKVYEVVHQKVGKWQTDYILKDVDGQFNAVWFDKVSREIPTYLAIASNIPAVGECLECNKIILNNIDNCIRRIRTSRVRKVDLIGESTYKVTTRNSIYVVVVK